MEPSLTEWHFEGEKSDAYIVKWKVKPGSKVCQGTVLLLYKDKNGEGSEVTGQETNIKKWKAMGVGTVIHLLKQEGDLICNGCPIMNVKGCSHPVVMKDMCAECGADLREENTKDQKSTASVAMVHSIPELMVSQEQAQILGKADEERLFRDRKLVLLVDLDQTLIHTTNDEVDPNLKDVYHFQLYGLNSLWFHTKIRPGTRKFLEIISRMYELHICTFGSRLYAHKVVQFLDKEGKYFSYRILSRDECFSANSKTANLSALFPCGDHLVCIIDDREDVWNFSPNLVHVKPYHYFQHTGDINAPPGLSKVDLDDTNTRKGSYKRTKRSDKSCKKLKTDNGSSKTEAHEDNVTEQNEPLETSPNKDSTQKESSEDSNGVELDSKEKNIDESKSDNVVQTASDKTVESPEQQHADEKENEESDDHDDYLLYLTDILTNIHQEFYRVCDQSKSDGSNNIPDLKAIVPQTRKQVLKGCNVVFSGVVPINLPLEKSRAYFVAKSLGAEIQKNIIVANGTRPATTHVIAARIGTVKVIEARKVKGIHVVTPDWLWCCSERWERVDEILFPLTKDTIMHSQFPQEDQLMSLSSSSAILNVNKDEQKLQTLNKLVDVFPTYDPVTGKRINKNLPNATASTSSHNNQQFPIPGPSSGFASKSSSYTFAKTINPLMNFSSEEIAKMGQEVDDEMNDIDSDSDESIKDDGIKKMEDSNLDGNSSSGESLSTDYPRKWKPESSAEGKKEDVDLPRFPRGELPHDSDRSENDQSDSDFADSIGSVDEEMVAAVEREFLDS